MMIDGIWESRAQHSDAIIVPAFPHSRNQRLVGIDTQASSVGRVSDHIASLPPVNSAQSLTLQPNRIGASSPRHRIPHSFPISISAGVVPVDPFRPFERTANLSDEAIGTGSGPTNNLVRLKRFKVNGPTNNLVRLKRFRVSGAQSGSFDLGEREL